MLQAIDANAADPALPLRRSAAAAARSRPRQLVQLYKPRIYLPTHHDASFSFVDMATEPLFAGIRDVLPQTRSLSPLYRTPVAIDMESRRVMVGA